jgi:UDP-N-acetylmuramoyl-tripeptide--D-alanyl-D-alanine ligase
VNLGKFAREHRRKFTIPVIAVTGSAGKTTTKDMLAAVLGQKFNVVKSAENQNNEVGVPLTLLKIESQHEIAIIEMAMRGLGQIEYLAKLTEPTHAIITNIGFTHLELLKTREAIATAKSEVVGKGMTVF